MTKQKNSKKNIFIALFTIFIMFWIAYALNTYQTWYKIPEAEDNSWKNYQIISDLPESYEGKNSCLKVSNYMANNQTTWFFSPTKTKTEWLNFKSWCNNHSNNKCKIEKKHSWEVFSRVMDGSKYATCAITADWWSGNWTSIKCWWKRFDNNNNEASAESDGKTPNLSGTHFYWNSNFNKNKVVAIYWKCHFGWAIDNQWNLKLWAYEDNQTGNGHKDRIPNIAPIPNWWDSNLKDLWVWDWFVCWIKKDWNASCWGWWWRKNLKCKYYNDPSPCPSNPNNSDEVFTMSNIPRPNWKKIKSIWWSNWGLCVVYEWWDLRCRWHKKNEYISNIPNLWDTWIKKVEWADNESICALKETWEINCWWNDSNITTNIPTGSDFIDIQTGQKHACGLKSNWEIICWGRNVYGDSQGSSNNENGSVKWPNQSQNNHNVKALWIWCYHSCLLYNNNQIKCWWLNNEHQSSPVPSFTPYQWNGLCTESLFE